MTWLEDDIVTQTHTTDDQHVFLKKKLTCFFDTVEAVRAKAGKGPTFCRCMLT